MLVDKNNRLRKKTIEFALKTLEEPDQMRCGERTIGVASIIAMAVLLIGPAFYFRDVGSAGYFIAFCSAIGGAIVFWGMANKSGSEQVECLGEFMDVKKMRSAIEQTNE